MERRVIFALLGALLGAVIGATVALAVGRNQNRLRERDEIANSIGIPVLTSFPVAHPANAAAWTKLLEDYKPGAVHAFGLRQALQQLTGVSLNGSGQGMPSFTVLSLSSDPGAFAIGPQLAAFAAAQGIPTTLVIAPQQDVKVTATLRAACAVPPGASSKRLSRLQVAVLDGDNVDMQPDATLTVVVAVVDSQNPQMPGTVRTAATLLGVSAGAATAEQLARVAMSAALDGRDIAGIIVADPEPTDQTTGRIPQLRSPHRRLPTRLKGMMTEIKR